ncbi:hypothetical protein [Leptospira kirschneri]|uniref:hypothetical protein n=1 Tax=Leptospira kirschneri TaxID=29507 RepID=UPI000289D8ED|nr:hypothetical protein [Leptospira kirschneri]EMK13145.1 hypothetical protein LEP1GSC042_3777 [Leptospira kirschneri serovar Bim str. PUO 1247]
MIYFWKLIFRKICIRSIVLLTVITLPVKSNSRAPKAVDALPGSILYAYSKNVKLLGEKLEITCENRCLIRANYKINSIQKGGYLFAFVLPASADLKIFQGQKVISVKSKPDLSRKELSDFRTVQYNGSKSYGLPHVAEFLLNLEEGIQEIEIRYQMRPGQNETGFGYFSFGDSDFWGVVEYDLWPAKEWVSENFQLTFEMSISEEQKFFIWGKRRKLACFGLQKNGYEMKNLGPQESFYHSGKKVLRYQFGSNFPDILRCTYKLKEPLYR